MNLFHHTRARTWESKTNKNGVNLSIVRHGINIDLDVSYNPRWQTTFRSGRSWSPIRHGLFWKLIVDLREVFIPPLLFQLYVLQIAPINNEFAWKKQALNILYMHGPIYTVWAISIQYIQCNYILWAIHYISCVSLFQSQKPFTKTITVTSGVNTKLIA